MIPANLSRALLLLRNEDAFEKVGGVLKGMADVGRAVDAAGKSAAEKLVQHEHPNLALLARFAPHAAVAGGGVAAYESDPVKRVRYKIQQFRYNRAMKRAQRGY